MKIIINSHDFETRNLKQIGSGGEADIFDIGNGKALKLFKRKDHIDYQGNVFAQKGAEDRLRIHQAKLTLFPKNLPQNVVVPNELAYDTKGLIRGYSMNLLKNPEPIFTFSQPASYMFGLEEEWLIKIFASMHKTVEDLHSKNIIIGDFNDLNVLITNKSTPWFIDADSYQFGSFPSSTFDERFVDPLLCILANPITHPQLCPDGKSHLVQVSSHGEMSDWYAFTVMFFQTLLSVHPYGGVYRPKSGPKVAHHTRPIEAISVFQDDVIYPKKARNYRYLPDDLLEFFNKTFAKKERGLFPFKLVNNLGFTTCTKCGTVHARSMCPECFGVHKNAIIATIRGSVVAEKLFTTTGKILRVGYNGKNLIYLYHDGNAYVREDKTIVQSGSEIEKIRYRITNKETLFGKDNEINIISKNASKDTFAIDNPNGLPSVATNSKNIFFTEGGSLYRVDQILGSLNRTYIGSVLKDATHIWAGERVGFGFYRREEIQRFFIFNTTGVGINDNISIPKINGKIIDVNCEFSGEYIWFFISTVEGSLRINRAYILDLTGKILAEANALSGDGSWLGRIRGSLAIANTLYVATEEGIVRVAQEQNTIQIKKEFPDTAPFVDSTSELYPGKGGIIVVSKKEIWQLTISTQ